MCEGWESPFDGYVLEMTNLLALVFLCRQYPMFGSPSLIYQVVAQYTVAQLVAQARMDEPLLRRSSLRRRQHALLRFVSQYPC
jgi:hypothetical protein